MNTIGIPRLLAEIILIAFGMSFSSGLILLGIDHVFFPCYHNYCGEDEVSGGISLVAGVILFLAVIILYLWLNIPRKEK